MNLLIKIPTRERGFDWLESYVQNITNPNTKIWLTLDMDDVNLGEADELTKKYTNVYCTLGISDGKIHAVNRDMQEITARFKNWDVLLLGSDDMQPQIKGFDDLILKHFENDNDKFLWSSDGRQPRICTIPIMGREYYERFDYIYHPNYKSFFCDNFQTDVALRLNKCLKTNECYLMHQHPAWGGTVEADNLYRRNDAFWNEDAKTYKIMSREITNYLGK
jgi:hypothetical protein